MTHANGILRFGKKQLLLSACAIAAGSLGHAPAALAAQDDGAANNAGLEVITVTARKRAESLQSTPVAVSAFTGDELNTRGVTNLRDVANYAPNVELFANSVSGSSAGQAYIRGVGQFDYLITTDPGVGVYVDGVYLARSLGNLLDLVDIERVEILRGPQGTLYGKNTIGGAINVISKRPSSEPEGAIDVKVGSYDRVDARLRLSGPIIEDVLAFKLAASTKNADGFGKRPLAGDRAGDENSDALQATLEWTAADNIDVTVSADYTRRDEAMSVHHADALNDQAILAGLYNALADPLASLHGLDLPPYDQRWVTADPYKDNSTGLNFSKSEIWGASGVITWDLGAVSLKSISAYRNLKLDFGTDPDGSPAVVIDELDRNRQDQFSQELQLTGQSFNDRFKWVAGGYYLREDAHAEIAVRTFEDIYYALEALPAAIIPLAPVTCPAPLPAPCAGGAGNPVNLALDVSRFITQDQTTKSASLYGQGSFDLTDRLSASYGIRYTNEKKDFLYSAAAYASGVVLVPPTSRDASWDDISHKIGLDYRFSDTVMTYVSAAKGFKSGGFNGRASSSAEITDYDPETIWSYEAGLKSELLDRRLRVNAAIFTNSYRDMQFTLVTANPDGSQLVTVGNAAKARVRGAELEFTALPVENLTLSGSVGFLDSEYREVDPSAGITTSQKLIGSPKWSTSAGAEYRVPVNDLFDVALRADYSYRTKVYFDAVNTEAIAQDSYGLLNLRAAIENVDGDWSIAAGVTNATDEAYRIMGVGVLDSLGFASGVYGRPREWYVQLAYKF